jgi:hypothetical protein
MTQAFYINRAVALLWRPLISSLRLLHDALASSQFLR